MTKQAKQSFDIDDLYLHRKVSDIDLGAGRAACVVRSADRGGDSYRQAIWAFALDGSSRRQMTLGTGQDTCPRWSPDGSQLAFLSDRSGGMQVHVMPADGGEARQLTRLPGAVSALRWTPDGRALIVTSAVTVDPDWRGERSKGRKPQERGPHAAEVAWKLPYKSDGVGFMLAREIHLFHVDASTGAAKQITDGPFDVVAFAVSPDGRHIAHVRTREGRFSHLYDLWLCGPDGSNARRLTHEHAMVMQPHWSPDGGRLAFSGALREGDARSTVWMLDVATAKVRQLGDDDTEPADPSSMAWTPDGKALVFAQAWRGRHRAARIATETSRLQVLSNGDRQLGGLAVSATHLAYVVEHPSLPSELWVSRADGGGERQLSDFNPWWRERVPVQAEVREFSVPDGKGGEEVIEGWLLRSEATRGAAPLLNDVHGGPASYALLDFDTNVYWQVLCARGWSVLALNAVGSASYGKEFCDRLMGRWGDADLPQHLAAIRQLQSEGVCDARVAIAGKSYGGYLSGWAIGHTTLFRAAVVMAPVGNIETHYGTSDGGYYADPLYMDAEERFDRALARRLSPLQHVEKAKTPTLFMQGKDDERCPKCQSEELFVSLMRAGDTPAELVLYPNQDHHFLGEGPPSVRADASRRIIDWVAKHVDTPVPELQEEQKAGATSAT